MGIVVIAWIGHGAPTDATGIQMAGVLDDLFAYDGPLGADAMRDGVTFNLWAPTAQVLYTRNLNILKRLWTTLLLELLSYEVVMKLMPSCHLIAFKIGSFISLFIFYSFRWFSFCRIFHGNKGCQFFFADIWCSKVKVLFKNLVLNYHFKIQ